MGVTLAFVSGPASAQDPEDDDAGWFDEEPDPAPDEAEPDAADPAPLEEPAPNVVAVEPPTEPASAPPPPDARPRVARPAPSLARERPGRFRWGLSPAFGGAQYGDDPDFQFLMGLEARFGGQLSDELAIYAVPSVLGSESLRVGTGLVFEGCLGDVLTIGAGADAALTSTDGWHDFVPGAGPQLRIGIHIGKDKPTRRKAFSMVAFSKLDFLFDGERNSIVGGMLGYDAM